MQLLPQPQSNKNPILLKEFKDDGVGESKTKVNWEGALKRYSKLRLGLTGKMSRNLFSFLRLFVLMIGFAVICLGAFCISTNASACKCNSLPIAYFLLPLGFLLLISGIFWSIYHEASRYKGLFFSIIHGNPRLQQNICTIDRSGVSNLRPAGQLPGRVGHGGGALRPSKRRRRPGRPLGATRDERPTTTKWRNT
ncbi:hypothetical protein EYD10_04131 [Varanus komodoensis]|nr:hypothetical protein EYD10_04131 [Varanus komodoensis]